MSGHGRARAYRAAVLVAAGATLLALVSTGAGHAGVFLPFVLAVTFSAWYGGRRAGFLATLFSSVALAGLFAADVASIGAATIDLLLVLAFVGTGGAIALLVGGLVEFEQARRADQERLRFALRAAQMVSWDWDVATGAVTWDPPGEGASGGPPGAFSDLYHAFLHQVHPDDRALFEGEIARATVAGSRYQFEVRTRRPDGRIDWLSVSGRVLRDDKGAPQHVAGVAMFVTERKRAERRLQAQHAVTRVLAESESVATAAPQILRAVCECLDWDVGAFWILDRHSEALRCLDVWRASSVQGADFEAATRERTFTAGVGLPGRVWATRSPAFIPDVVTDDNFPRAPVAAREGLHGAFGFPILLGSDVRGVLEFFSHEIRAPDDDLLAMMAAIGSQIGQFIERKRGEEETVHLLQRAQVARADAEAAERRATLLAEVSRLLASSLDYETTVASVARLALPHLADWCVVDMVRPDGSLRRLAVAHVDPSKLELAREIDRRYPPEAADAVARVIRTGCAECIEDISDEQMAAGARDGEHLSMLRALGLKSFMCTPLAVRGRTLGAISFVSAESGRRYGPADLAFAEELTTRAAVAIENALLYRQAEEASRVRDRFLAKASHELRSPLGTILLWVDMLRSKQLDPEKTALALERIESRARFLADQINDLLDASRLVVGKLQMDFQPLELGPVIEAALMPARRAAAAAGITLEARLDSSIGLVAGDRNRLQQVFANLLRNAIKFTPKGGRVELDVERRGTEASVAVSDSGSGIRPELLANVFEHFTQDDDNRSGGGLGLGLAIVRHVVQRHGGIVEAESAGVGQGARFTVRLPLLASETATRAVG